MVGRLDDEPPLFDPTSYKSQLSRALEVRREWAKRCMDNVHLERDRVQDEEAVRFRSKAKIRRLKPGDQVLVHTEPISSNDLTAKFLHPWRGPYTVISKAPHAANEYILEATLPEARVGNKKFDNPTVFANRMKIDHRESSPYYYPPATLQSLLPYLGLKWTSFHNDECEVCAKGGLVRCCDWCNVTYHKKCLEPLADAWKEGDDWACPMCLTALKMV